MIRAHAAAVKAAVAAAGATVWEPDEIPNLPDPPNYAVVFVDLGRGTDPRLQGNRAARAWRVQVRYVGSTADEARWVAEKAWTALEDKTLSVTGRRCTPCRSESSRPVVEDQDDEDIYTGDTVWTFASHPA